MSALLVLAAAIVIILGVVILSVVQLDKAVDEVGGDLDV